MDSTVGRLLLICSSLLLISSGYAQKIDTREESILMELKLKLKPTNNYTKLGSWIPGQDCSDWRGITCDTSGYVIELDLTLCWLEGTIPSIIGNLSHLKYIDLSANDLTGSIPSSIGNLASLTHLDLSYNSLSGTVPSTIQNLKSLNYLNLVGNHFPTNVESSCDPNTCTLNDCEDFLKCFLNNESSNLTPTQKSGTSSTKYGHAMQALGIFGGYIIMQFLNVFG